MNIFQWKREIKIIIAAMALAVFVFPLTTGIYRIAGINTQSSQAFAQARTGADANTTTKSSGSRDGVSKTSGSFPGFVKGFITGENARDRVSGASVSLTQLRKAVSRLTSARDGAYFFQAPPGNYTIEAEMQGIGSARVQVAVSAFETLSKNISLKIGGNDEPTETETETETESATETETETSTETPTGTATETSEPTTTPTEPEGSGVLATLTIEPERARVSKRMLEAVVTALDKLGQPVSGVTISAKTRGLQVRVRPKSAVTDSEGKATFKYRFDVESKLIIGKITFSVEGLDDVVLDRKRR